jgi:hypothetical protein
MTVISMLEFLERREKEHEERKQAVEDLTDLGRGRHPAARRADKRMGK